MCAWGVKNKYGNVYRGTEVNVLSISETMYSHHIHSKSMDLYKCKIIYTTAPVCFLPIHSGHQVDVPAGSQDFFIHLSSAVRALIFSRETNTAIPFPLRP